MENIQHFIHFLLDLLRDPASATFLAIVSLLTAIRLPRSTNIQKDSNQRLPPNDEASQGQA